MHSTKPKSLILLKVNDDPILNGAISHLYLICNQQDFDMIVFCHLRWDVLYQRPHHIISRFAKDLKVLFVEEPLPKPGQGNVIRMINDNLYVLQPNITDIQELPQILENIIKEDCKPMAWFYSPSFCAVLESFPFSLVVYDYM